ncbi:MAG: hypothetical protein ABFD66_02740, partial [Smithella sp.]
DLKTCQFSKNNCNNFTGTYTCFIVLKSQKSQQFKRWTRKWKIELIEKENPDWRDLADDWFSAQQE